MLDLQNLGQAFLIKNIINNKYNDKCSKYIVISKQEKYDSAII